MGQVTPWRYSSTGNESTERGGPFWSLASSLQLSTSILSECIEPPSSIFTRVFATRNEFLRTCPCTTYVQSRATISQTRRWTKRAATLDGSTIGWCESSSKEVVGKVDGRGDSIEPSAGYRGMFLALLGVVAYRECIVCWSGR